ncbi:MAG TPA: TIGR02710 family CRISPR-associated CARF protein [Thermoanaerobaculia bacterium]|nr:TIGR02710 family CRISPR-associated CARF protein [Thermoanaerobaculia bacterium]
MTRVLVLTVGGSDAPIVNAIEQTRSDFVYFLCSGGESPRASERTIRERVETERHRPTCPRCDTAFEVPVFAGPITEKAGLAEESFRVECVEDPDVLDQVTGACHRIAEHLKDRFGEPSEVYANYTGGTKTMTLGLGLFAYVARPRWILQFNGGRPRNNLVKIKAGDVAMRQQADGLRVREVRKRAAELAARADYAGALALLEATIQDLGPQATASLREARLGYLARAARDRFDLEEARRMATEAGEDAASSTKELRDLLRARELLDHGSPWRPQDVSGRGLVDELVENAERCAERGRFDDAVARLYRATELLSQVRLHRAYGVVAADLAAPSDLWDADTSAWLAARQHPDSGAVHLGLIGGLDFLRRLGDPLGRRFTRDEKRLLSWIELRNRSILAHGLQPVRQTEWRRAGAPWIQWLREAAADLDLPRP